jgi:hypothetical protein
MALTSDAEVSAIGAGLRDKTLTKAQWTHAAHLTAGLWVVTSHLPGEALPAIREMIRRFNEHVGVKNTETDGYHETITAASIRAIEAFRSDRPDLKLHQICNELLSSYLADPKWLLGYWSRDRLFSVEARHEWTEPDLKSLPF